MGIYHDAGPLGAVVPLDSRIQRDFFVLPEDPSVGRHYVFEGDVVVAIGAWAPGRKTLKSGEALDALEFLEEFKRAPESVDLGVAVLAVVDLGIAGNGHRACA